MARSEIETPLHEMSGLHSGGDQDVTLHPKEIDALADGRHPTAETGGAATAMIEAQRAIDRAVMSMFELAFSLETLGDAIRRLKTETKRELRERHDAIIGVDPDL
jgi:hypothetical protein